MADAGELKYKVTAEDEGLKETLDDAEKAAKKAAKGVDDLGDSSKDSGKSIGALDVAVGSFVAGAGQQLVGALIDAVKSFVALADETREYREDMAKLNAAFKTAGHTTDAAKKAYDGFYKILGESDRTVEAVNHLAELTDNEEELAKWTDICAGVTAKFGDSLPIEGLTEAANETAKVGAVTGPLADALNWAGISEEKFNEQLAKCNSEQERAALITNTLSTEYQAAAAEYNTLTASTQAAREATNQMEQAQAQLGATIEPLTTLWTQTKAAALSWLAEAATPLVARTVELTQKHDVLTASQRAGVTAALESAAAFREMTAASQELAAVQTANVDYVANSLLPQLEQIVDSNGRVKEGEEARAEFILGQLNEALGTEYTSLRQIVDANGQIKDSIYAAIEAKKAQILLNAYEDDYATAVKEIAAAERARAEQATYLADQSDKVAEAEKKLQDAQKAATDAALTNDRAKITSAANTLKSVQAEYDKEKKALDELQTNYAETAANVDHHYKLIDNYTIASTLLMQGETEKAMSYLNNLSGGYATAEEAIAAAAKNGMKTEAEKTAFAEAEMLKRVVATQTHYQLLVDEYAANEATMTAEQKKQAEARIKQAATEADKAVTEFEKVGGNIPEGMAKGADGKSWTLTGMMKTLVDRAVAAAKKASDSHSPSKRFAEEVGEPIAQGIAVGIENEADKPVEAAKDVIDDLADYLEAEQKKTVKTVKDYNAEIAKINEDHNAKLKELDEQRIKDKKKKNADRKAIDERYVKDVAEANEQVTEKIAATNEKIRSLINDRMSELVKLEADYKASVDALWSNLGAEIASLQDNYTSQLESRAKSIASSLNLWAEVGGKANVSWLTLTRNLETQVDRLKDYNEAIDKLSARGVSKEFLDEIKGMGVDATGEIETLVSMSDKQLTEYVALWEEKSELSRQAATKELETLKAETLQEVQNLTAAAVDEYEKLRADYQAQATKLTEELSAAMKDAGETGYEELIAQLDDYTAAGGDLMDGVITGITTKAPALSEAVTSAVQRAIAAAKAAAGIASPSKVMRDEVGKFLPLGMAEGIAETMPAVEKQLRLNLDGLTARMQATVSEESARAGQSYATQYDGTGDIVRAVGMQTAGINSLASEYRSGTGNRRPIVLMLDRRELGRAMVDVGAEETARVGLSY